MDPYGDHAMTYKHIPHTICCHDRMPYVQNIIANETGLKSCLEKTGLIVSRKDRPSDVLLPMFCVGQDAYLDFVITHMLQPTFIDCAAGKSLVATKVAAAKKHSNDNKKCCRNGLRMIVMALGNVRRLHPRDAHHDSQDCHPPCRQAQPTPMTDHLLDQSVPFCHASA